MLVQNLLKGVAVAWMMMMIDDDDWCDDRLMIVEEYLRMTQLIYLDAMVHFL